MVRNFFKKLYDEKKIREFILTSLFSNFTGKNNLFNQALLFAQALLYVMVFPTPGFLWFMLWNFNNYYYI